MESVGKASECVEHALGEVLAARSAAITNSENVPGVGPPDLCWIQRTARGFFSMKKPKMQGYYHWVVGLPVTSSASIAAYFARLTSTKKKVGYYQGMGMGREFTIGRGIYCCYDPFSDLDIWVEIAVPGSAISRGLDRQGYLHDVTAEMWKGAYVGCFLRSEVYDASVTLHCSRAFHHMAFFRGQEDEEELLQDVESLYQCGVAQRAQQRLHWDKGQGTEPHHMDVVCTSLLDHFKKRRRWQKALRFFTELEDCFPSSVVYQAEVYRELDNSTGAANLLKSALLCKKKEDHPMLVLACGYIYLEDRQYTKAIKIAESVLDIDPQIRPGWLLLSRALSYEGQTEKCLRALHLMPSPLIPSDRNALLFRVLPSRPKSITRRQDGYDPETAELNMVFQESQKTGVLTGILPGEILAPRCQAHGTDWGFISCTQCVMRAAYDILLKTVHSIGWEQFCRIRATVFMLPSDEEGMGSEKGEWCPIRVELTVHEDAPPTANRLVALSFVLKESIPWEKPRRKTSYYARSISAGASNTVLEADSSLADRSHASQVATKVLSRGLGGVTKRILRRPSTESVLRDDAEQILSPTSETLSDAFSNSSRTEGRNRVAADSEAEPDTPLSPYLSTPFAERSVFKVGADTPVRQRKIVEVVTTAELLSEQDEVPDAPENALPREFPPYGVNSVRGPPSSTSFSQDRWQVKIVSMGIKERVKYFDQMAKEKMAKQSLAASDSQYDHEACVVNMRPRRSRYLFSHTIMERLIHDITSAESIAEVTVNSDEGGSGDADEGELDSSESTETGGVPSTTDWSSFALNKAACVPRTSNRRRSSHTSLFDGNLSGCFLDVVPHGPHRDIDKDNPCECAEWLDELILSLWEDLAVYTDFKALDRKLKSKNRQTHAEQILGTIEWNADTTDDEDHARTPTAGPVLPDSRPVDWMRRGMLCERLGKTADAEQAYRVCIFLSFNLTSLLALARIYSEWGYSKGAVLLLNRLAQFHHKKRNSHRSLYVVESLVKNMSLLMSSVGNKEIRSASETSHPLLSHALEDVLKWNMQSGSPRMNNPSQ